MHTRNYGRIPVLSQSTKQLIFVCGLFIAACILGLGIIAVGGTSSSRTIGLGLAAVLGLSGIIAVAMDLPVMGLVRFGFVSTFFFKGDLNLFKVDEIEDPSGLNIPLTLFFGLILLAHDHYFKNVAEDRQRIFPSVFWYLVISLFGTAAISVLYAGATLLGGFSLLSLSTTILITYIIASHFGRRERMLELVVAIAAGLLFTCLVSLSQHAFDFPTNLPNFGTGTEEELLGTQSQILSRVPAFLRTPTEMAWVVSSLIPLVLAPLVCRVKSIGSTHKVLFFAASIAAVVSVILSLARGSWIGVSTTLMLLLLLGWYKLSAYERSRYFTSALATVILAIAVLSPFAGKISDRLTEDDQGSALIRVPLMETALRMIDDNPIVGVGLNGYRPNMTKYDETGIFVSQVFPNPVHNIFAHITAEIGILGGILFCLLILYSLYESVLTMGSGDRLIAALSLGLGLGMVAFVISGIKEPGSLGSTRPPIRTCFLLIGVIFALRRIHYRVI